MKWRNKIQVCLCLCGVLCWPLLTALGLRWGPPAHCSLDSAVAVVSGRVPCRLSLSDGLGHVHVHMYMCMCSVRGRAWITSASRHVVLTLQSNNDQVKV